MPDEDLDALYWDPRHYDAKYAGIVEDIPFLVEMVRKYGDPALELMCGTGRVTIPIALEGFDVTGIDRSGGMLDLARKKARDAGVEVPWIEGDVRDLHIGRRFRTVMIPFNSIQHLTRLEDLRAVFDFVREHIADDGVFIVDLFNPNLEFLLECGVRRMQAHSGYPDPDGGGPVRVEETREYDRARQVNRITWYFRIGGGPERTVGFDMRVIFPQELRLLVEHMGFEILKVYGDYDLNPFRAGSPKQIVICRPRPGSTGREPAGAAPAGPSERGSGAEAPMAGDGVGGDQSGGAGPPAKGSDDGDEDDAPDGVNIDEIMRRHHGDAGGDDGWATS